MFMNMMRLFFILIFQDSSFQRTRLHIQKTENRGQKTEDGRLNIEYRMKNLKDRR